MQAYGYDVLEVQPNTGQERDSTYTRLMTIFDSRTGPRKAEDRADVAVVKSSGFNWQLHGRREIEEFRAFLQARKGACVPFWVPTWQHDLVLAADIGAGIAGLKILNMGYTKFMWADPARRYLAIFALDGSQRRAYRKIVSSAEGTPHETLTLDGAVIPSGQLLADQVLVSFLTLVRLAADDPELIWHSRDTAEVTLSFVEVPLEVPA